MNTTYRRLREEKGFTLVELLIVVVILGVLSGIVVFAVGAFTDEGEAEACNADFKTVEVAQEAYRAQKGEYAKTDTTTGIAKLVSGEYLRTAPTGITIDKDGKVVKGC